MLRSLLFVPGARPERFAKACEAGADAVCIDLEDAVAPDDKAAARAAVIDYLSGAPPHPRVGLRINRVGSAFGVADLAALAASTARPAFVMAPKVESAEDLGVASEALGAPKLWPIIESALGMHRAWDIAGARGVEGVLFGGADYSADIGATLDWEPMLFARSTLVNACAGAGVELLDVPYLDVNDDAGLAESTRRARALGFTGRACIHPKQVAGVNAVFTPSAAEIVHARRVLAAFEDAKGAAALLDGKLIELPVIRAARRALAAAGEA
jgi:citrate lyase subunit beta/citryl-CoA lyase/(S)-citramalyl-CoA lyase